MKLLNQFKNLNLFKQVLQFEYKEPLEDGQNEIKKNGRKNIKK